MISYHKGDLLESGCDIICHQVNLQGIMGGGLALQIATKYPEVEQDYKMFCEDWNKYANLGGEVLFSKIYGTNNYIANCFSQDEDFTTRYDWLKECIEEIKRFIGNGKCKVGIPKNYGCGIAKGDWNKVKEIWESAFEDESDIELQIWEL